MFIYIILLFIFLIYEQSKLHSCLKIAKDIRNPEDNSLEKRRFIEISGDIWIAVDCFTNNPLKDKNISAQLPTHNKSFQQIAQKHQQLFDTSTDNDQSLLQSVPPSINRLHMYPEAKETLKKSMIYIDNPHSDPILQGICLSNFANLYKQRKKYWKCLKYSLKGVEIVQTYMHQCRSKTKKQKQQIAILLVVLLIYAKNSSSQIMKSHETRILKQYFEFVNYLGYKTCSKYLGKDSIFNQFDSTQKYFHLPVFTQQAKSQSAQKDNGRQTEIVNQLSKIYQILKTKQNPQFVVINTSNITQPRLAEVNQTEQSIFINNQINQVIIQQKNKPKPEPQQPIKPPIPITKQQQKKQECFIQQLFKPLIVQKDEQKIQLPQITINQKQIEQQMSHHYVPSQSDASDQESLPPLIMAQQMISVNKWQIKFRLQKQKDQRVGNLSIEYTNKKSLYKELITQQKLDKITCQINKEDKLSYEIINQELVQQEFIEFYIKPFFNINQKGKISILPHSKGLIQPFQISFLNQESYVFFNHIRNNLFRVVISPVYSCKSIYLNMQFSQSTIVEYFVFEQQNIGFINAIFKAITNSPAVSTPASIKNKNKSCKVINQQQLVNYIKRVVNEFQNSLLNRQDQTAVNQIIQNQLVYYKYQEIKKNKLGIYYFIRYLPSINYFDIYLKNNYETFSIDGKIKSRGNALYKAQDFLQDFGIPLKASKKNLFAYIQIIAKKYYLLTFQRPITDNDNDRYVQNAILDLAITENCYQTKLFKKEGYFIPITISLLTINSETPIGLKIIEYDPITCRNRGFFIHIVSNDWVRPYRKPAITINNILFNTYINQFPFRSEYFLPQWLEKIGFAILFNKIMDPLSQLYLQHNINHLVRGKVLVKIFNNEDST